MDTEKKYDKKWFEDSYSRVYSDKETDWLSYNAVARFASQGLGQNSLILEVGCGLGTLCHRLSEHNDRVVGLDVSEYAVLKARSMYKDDRISFVVGDAGNLPFKSAAFDGVVVSHLFEHLSDSDVSPLLTSLFPEKHEPPRSARPELP